ncbi:hypothetical protein OBBRIDRAFT_827017 [Obba rivulosa]|uniref:Uncharacterized protein n=1 Tax=Obba rivulosa TaxID=1052685 RepID=A0A8E2DMY2_9APHY|nr:hypothetical protein OBBRIDRAFT_827017 [Obba rivulosa]
MSRGSQTDVLYAFVYSIRTQGDRSRLSGASAATVFQNIMTRIRRLFPCFATGLNAPGCVRANYRPGTKDKSRDVRLSVGVSEGSWWMRGIQPESSFCGVEGPHLDHVWHRFGLTCGWLRRVGHKRSVPLDADTRTMSWELSLKTIFDSETSLMKLATEVEVRGSGLITESSTKVECVEQNFGLHEAASKLAGEVKANAGSYRHLPLLCMTLATCECVSPRGRRNMDGPRMGKSDTKKTIDLPSHYRAELSCAIYAPGSVDNGYLHEPPFDTGGAARLELKYDNLRKMKDKLTIKVKCHQMTQTLGQPTGWPAR